MRIALIATTNFAIIRFITGVNMGMLFPIRTVGKPTIAALKFAFKWLLAYSIVIWNIETGNWVS